MADEQTPQQRELQNQETCPHINCMGHEWESWCMDCGKRWPNNLHLDSTTYFWPGKVSDD